MSVGALNIGELSALGWIDWALLAAIFVALPIETEFANKFFKKRIVAGAPGARVKSYLYTGFILWLLTIAVLFVWRSSGRDWATLGFQFQFDLGAQIAWALTALVIGFFLTQLILISTNAKARKLYHDAIAHAGEEKFYFMPAKPAEYTTFNFLAVTAGITEEVIFRGFVITALAALMPTELAALISLCLFVFLHRYQGVKSFPKIAIAGGVMTAVFLLSGSLYPAIAMHIAMDIFSGAIFWRASRAKFSD